MSSQIVDLKEEKKRREHHRLMKAKYAALMLAETSLADEAEALVTDRKARETLPPKQPER
jgi:hypothetical protein